MHHHSHGSDCAHHHSVASIGTTTRKIRLLLTVLILVSGFSVIEVVVGRFSHSLALLADSGHMLADGLALGVAIAAAWMSRDSTPNPDRSSHRRIEIFAALVNGVGLVAIASWIAWEAMLRLQSPPAEILSLPMVATASVGLVVNSINVLLLHTDSQHDLNLRGAFLHIVADLVSSVGVILAAIAVWWMNWLWADGVISLFVSGLIILGALPLIVQSLNLLVQQPARD